MRNRSSYYFLAIKDPISGVLPVFYGFFQKSETEIGSLRSKIVDVYIFTFSSQGIMHEILRDLFHVPFL